MCDAILLIGDNRDLRIKEIADCCQISMEKAIVVLQESAAAVCVSFDEFTNAVHLTFAQPFLEEERVLKLRNILSEMEAIEAYEQASHSQCSYDKFLPKPIGRQRRKRR